MGQGAPSYKTTGGVHIVTYLDDCVQEEATVDLLVQGGSLMELVASQCRTKLDELGGKIDSMCPKGWQMHKETMLAKPDVQKHLFA
eukprot:2308420-Alexandrium_andersonii.AAC.1